MAQASKAKRPMCWRSYVDETGKQRRCMRTGYPVTLHGSFSDGSMLLCHTCVREVQARGWKVSYAIDADRPPDFQGASV